MAARGLTALAVQRFLLRLFQGLTLLWAHLQRVLSRLMPVRDRAPQRLPPPRWLSVSDDGCLLGLKELPELPALPPGELSLYFCGCANLSMYMFGAAYAMQKAPGGEDVKWSVGGGSSGSFVAAPFAMGADCSESLLFTLKCFQGERCRVGGCIGAYSKYIRLILQAGLRQAKEAGVDPLSRAAGRLGVDVTHFDPKPQQATVTAWDGEAGLINAVLASCYIPVAYEEPIVLPHYGFCIDGCATNFLPNARCVVSPYAVHKADVSPEFEYSETLVFNLLHGSDVLRLFEDGYLDCHRWLEKGAPSRSEERTALVVRPGASLSALVGQGIRTALSLAGLRAARPRPSV